MRRHMKFEAAILTLITLGSAGATAADPTVTISSVSWDTVVMSGMTFYRVKANGTFTADTIPADVRISRPVGPPPPTDQGLGVDPGIVYNPVTKSGTWTITSSVLFVSPPALMTVDAKLEKNGVVIATTFKNLSFP